MRHVKQFWTVRVYEGQPLFIAFSCPSACEELVFPPAMDLLLSEQWRRQDFLLEGQNGMGSGAEPQKNFFLDHALYFGYKCDQRPFYRLT